MSRFSNLENKVNRTDWAISSLLATMSIRANDIYENEKIYVPHNVAIARALSDTLKEFVVQMTVENHIGREVPIDIIQRPDFLEHFKKKTFMNFASDIYDRGLFASSEHGYPFTDSFRYGIAVLDLTKTKENMENKIKQEQRSE